MEKFSHGGDIYRHPTIKHDFSVNLNPLGMPLEVAQAIRAAAGNSSAYPDPNCSELRAALAESHGVSPESILCGNGAADIIIRLALALKPKAVLSLAPGFSEYEKAAALCGASFKVHTLAPENDFFLTASVLEAVSPDVELVYLCNPNNPTGRLSDPELLAALLKKCEERGAILAVDECFLQFTNAPSMASQLSSPNLVIINAFTKTYAMAGLRLGYMLTANEALLSRVRAFAQSWSVSSVAQAAGIAALKCENHISSAKALLSEQRPYLTQGLKKLGIHVYPSEANFLLCRSEAPIYEMLLSRGILLRSAENFLTLDERYFRVCVSTQELNALLLNEISEVLNG